MYSRFARLIFGAATEPSAEAPSLLCDSRAVPRPASISWGRTVLTRWWLRRHGILLLALAAALIVGFSTRVVLLLKTFGQISWDASLAGVFAWGAVFDVAAALWWILPLATGLAILPANFFQRRVGRALAHGAVFFLLYVLLFGAVAEWFFWDEFGTRLNFIAIDYLVYTTEVLGNIRESYPLPMLLGAIAVLALAGTVGLRRTGWLAMWLAPSPESPGRRWRATLGWAAVALGTGTVLQQNHLPHFANAYHTELAKNGQWSLFAAFRGNQLDYDTFYPTLPTDEAFSRVSRTIPVDNPTAIPTAAVQHDLLRPVMHTGPELRLNVIQITVESLSADFLTRYGNRENLTPHLDAIIPRSLVFDRFYATGNRTDRGMEALTLSVPPTPGRSLVKRPENAGLFTLGSVFRQKGYSTSFVYGGFGYFDNMNAFFGGNGYRVLDRAKMASSDITFANAWGACDEDLFRWTLREADQQFAAARPFFQFVMTTSNHRPFTYPAGRIDLPPKTSGRSGGVKYTDFAIGEFLNAASTRPWFNQTVFVIVADHCASSAGRSELPVEHYHIPLIIYAPGGQLRTGAVATLSSQVDFGPTLLGLLNWSYPTRFYGRDVLALPADVPGRALIANYQKLGLYQDGRLVMLQPVRHSATFAYDESTHVLAARAADPELTRDAIGYYQSASWLFKHHRQSDITSGALVP